MAQKLFTRYIFQLTLFSFVFCSCNYALVDKEEPEINYVKTKTRFRINLPEEHSSGYLWQLSDNYDMTKIIQLNSVWHGPSKGVDFNFESLDVGNTTLTFVLRKYNDTSEIKHFRVHIVME